MERNHQPEHMSAEIERAAYRRRVEVFLDSRDDGNRLTLDSLKTGMQLSTIVAAAAEVAQHAEAALAAVKNQYRPPLHCKEGCSYCCCKPGVLISIPELLRILSRIQSSFPAKAVSELRERARRYSLRIAGRDFNDPINESIPCPLLVDDRCSVYEVRPLTCRGYNSMNVHACHSAQQNGDVLIPIFSLLKDVTDGATVGAAHGLKAAGLNDSLVDLGTALDIALEAGKDFPEAAINGGAALLPAENSSMVPELWTRVCGIAGQVGVDVNLSDGRNP